MSLRDGPPDWFVGWVLMSMMSVMVFVMAVLGLHALVLLFR